MAQISLMYDVFYHNIDHLARARCASAAWTCARAVIPAVADLPCSTPQHVWATRRDHSYLPYLMLHFTVHGA